MVESFTRTDNVDTVYANDVNDLSSNDQELLKYCRDTILVNGTGSIDATYFNYPNIQIFFHNGNYNNIASGQIAKPSADALIIATVNRSSDGATATLSLVEKANIATTFPDDTDNSAKVILGIIDISEEEIHWNSWSQDETSAGTGLTDAEIFALGFNDWIIEENSLTAPNSATLINHFSTTFATDTGVNTTNSTASVDTSNKKVVCGSSGLTESFEKINDLFNDSSINTYWTTDASGTGNSVTEDATQLTIIANANTDISDAGIIWTKDPITGMFYFDTKVKIDSTDVVSGNLNVIEIWDKTFSGTLSGATTPHKDIFRISCNTSTLTWRVYVRVDDSNYYTWDEANTEWDKNVTTTSGTFATDTDYYIRIIRRADGNLKTVISTNSDFSTPIIDSDYTGTGTWVTNGDTLKDLNESVFCSVGDPYTNAGYAKFYVGLGKIINCDNFWISKTASSGTVVLNSDGTITTDSYSTTSNVSFLRSAHTMKLEGSIQVRLKYLGSTANDKVPLLGLISSAINGGIADDNSKYNSLIYVKPDESTGKVNTVFYSGTNYYSWNDSTDSWVLNTAYFNYNIAPDTYFWVEIERTANGGLYLQLYSDNAGSVGTAQLSNSSAPDGSNRPYVDYSSYTINFETDPVLVLIGDLMNDANGGSVVIDKVNINGAEFKDNCNNAVVGTSDNLIFKSNTSGSGTVTETSGEIQFDSAATTDACIIQTNGALDRGFDITAKFTHNSATSGSSGGILICESNVTAPNTSTNMNAKRKVQITGLGNGSTIDYYMIYVNTGGTTYYWTGSAWTSSSTAFLTGVTAGTSYYFRIYEDIDNSQFVLEVLNSSKSQVEYATIAFSSVRNQSGSSYEPSVLIIGEWKTDAWTCDMDVDEIEYFDLTGYVDSILELDSISKESGNTTNVTIVYHTNVQSVTSRQIQFKANDTNIGSAITSSSDQKGVVTGTISSSANVTIKADMDVGNEGLTSPEVLNMSVFLD